MSNVGNENSVTVTLTMKVKYDRNSVRDKEKLAFLLENEFEQAAVRSGVLSPNGYEIVEQIDFATSITEEG